MAKSMTGFGRARETVNGKDITVEIKSVNNRYFDCSVKISRGYAHVEDRIKPYLQSLGVSRGKIDVWVGVENTTGMNGELRLNDTFLDHYLQLLYRLRDEKGLKDDISVMSVARNPEIFTQEKPEEDADRDWEEIASVLKMAAERFLQAREKEGEKLCADILQKLDALQPVVDEIEQRSIDSIAHYGEKLAERLRAVLADNRITPDENRILTECAIFADKVAVDEELVRLRTHFGAMRQALASDEPIGRRLDFLVQEMNREINTTGSKCNNAEIAQLVVSVKCELEKIREQLQNLE